MIVVVIELMLMTPSRDGVLYAVADPGGGPEARPPAPVKTSQKKMVTVFCKSSGTPRTNFWIRYWYAGTFNRESVTDYSNVLNSANVRN